MNLVVELGRLTWPEVDRTRPVVLVPIGSTEQHGPHLPLDTDTRIAVALCERAAAALTWRDGTVGIVDGVGGVGAGSGRPGIVVAPPVTYGASGEHAGFAGTLSIGQDALEQVVVELVRSAGDAFALVVLVNGHGGNAEPLGRAVATMEHEGRPVALWSPRIESGDSHAGRVETSVVLALDPAAVRMSRAEPGASAPLSELWPALRADGLAAVTPNGVLGDPTGATVAEGEELLARWTRELVELIDAQLVEPR